MVLSYEKSKICINFDNNCSVYVLYTITSNDRLKYIRCAVTVNSSVDNVFPETKYSSPTATKVVLYGDADMNGVVNTFDTTEIQYYLSDLVEFSSEQIVASDVTGDGKINTFDVSTIQFYLAGSITSFPVED